MDAIYTHCCGLDVHQKSVTACLITSGDRKEPQKTLRTFGATTDELLALADWLEGAGCTHVAMESTGVYWKPIYNLLEGQFELLLVNAQHLKSVPGRKTDVHDAEWIADLLRCGLLKGSFVPSREQRELRELTRYRTSLVQERARQINRVHKVLEGANIKLGAVVSDIMGVSAREMLTQLLAGETDAHLLAELSRGRLREKRAELEKALSGRMHPHQQFMLAELLAHIDYLDEAIARASAEIGERMSPFEEQIVRLDEVPGLNRQGIEAILAEIGTDLSRFPDAAHLASWAAICPGNNESAGKRRKGKARRGNRWLRQALVEAAHGAARKKDSYLASQYAHLRSRCGDNKATIAVAHSILVIIYHMLTKHQPYHDLGATYLDSRKAEWLQRSLVNRLERLGFDVTLTPLAPAA